MKLRDENLKKIIDLTEYHAAMTGKPVITSAGFFGGRKTFFCLINGNYQINLDYDQLKEVVKAVDEKGTYKV